MDIWKVLNPFQRAVLDWLSETGPVPIDEVRLRAEENGLCGLTRDHLFELSGMGLTRQVTIGNDGSRGIGWGMTNLGKRVVEEAPENLE